MDNKYSLGLHEVGNGCFAYLQPDGGWGYSNAGLVVGDGESLLVDTLFDLKLTQQMLDSMSIATSSSPINTVVNTHANGDHCYGNQLVRDATIIASEATAKEMGEVPPSMLAALNKAPGEVGDLFRSFFGDFSFDEIELVLPTETFCGKRSVSIGGSEVQLIEVGPAHTAGDTIAYVPNAKTVYTGDILFIGGQPIVWAGPLQNWIAACDVIVSLDCDVVVPGHGPITDNKGVRDVRDYLSFVLSEATSRKSAGMDAFDAAKEIAREISGNNALRFSDWKEFGRISVNVDTVYRSLDAAHKSPDVIEQFRRMAQIESNH